MPPPTAQEIWLTAFARTLTEARPDLGQKFARLIAVRSWARHKNMTAEDAVMQWLATSEPR